MTQFTEAPIFDADQHMYETPEALTKYLPDRFRKAVQFVQVGRHTRIAILNKITEYIPNPTFERVAAPGAHERFYSGQNPEGLTMRQMTGTPIEARQPPATQWTGSRSSIGRASMRPWCIRRWPTWSSIPPPRTPS
ncbi:amidohydrolase family domain protein [Mycobacterium xenopi 3993]|nr:amidohydrolase family domain protein [Mycobacterium xenopi 3993]